MINKYTHLKIISIICMFIIIIISIIINNNPATSFEYSIYTQTPVIVWIGLLFIILSGITITIYNISSKYWFIGLLLVLWANFIILTLFIMRGYAFMNAGGDTGFHVEAVKQMILSGFFERQNVYPIIHVFLTEIHHVSGLNIIFLFRIIPVIFSMLLTFFVFITAKYLFKRKEDYIFATLASTPLLFGWYLNISPQHIATMFFPFAFYIIIRSYKTNNMAWKILLVMILFLYAPFHPVPSFVLLLILCLKWINPKDIFYKFKIEKNSIFKNMHINPVIITLFMVLIISWISSFGVWETTVINVNTLLTEGGPRHIDIYSEEIISAQQKGYNLFEYIFNVYGGLIIYLFLVLLAFPIIWRKKPSLLWLYTILFIIMFSTGLLLILNIVFTPNRMLYYITLISVFPVGYLISNFKRNSEKSKNLKKIAPLLIIITFFGISMLGVSSVYPSDHTFEVSYHSTYRSIHGSEWLINYKDTTIPWSSWYYNLNRYAKFLNIEENRTDLTIYNNLMFPDHFGYNVNSTLGKSFNEDRYLVIQDSLKYVYTEIYPEQANERLLESDFDLLKNDKSLYKIYSNNDKGYDVWFVNKK